MYTSTLCLELSDGGRLGVGLSLNGGGLYPQLLGGQVGLYAGRGHLLLEEGGLAPGLRQLRGRQLLPLLSLGLLSLKGFLKESSSKSALLYSTCSVVNEISYARSLSERFEPRPPKHKHQYLY